jgi:hypothetical protein
MFKALLLVPILFIHVQGAQQRPPVTTCPAGQILVDGSCVVVKQWQWPGTILKEPGKIDRGNVTKSNDTCPPGSCKCPITPFTCLSSCCGA